ncbi:hypothetical protein [Sphingomonas sp. IW22]|uniref:hypothetical protein n=1 Tax=Sphingomonas sp. IW22 TaxID=3242489 RepID=UPI00351F894A
MRIGMALAAMALPLLSGGCIAKTAWDVATLPVKATGQAVDWATTSQEEADRNYGRKMRKKEAEEGRRLREEERRRKREEREWRDDDD